MYSPQETWLSEMSAGPGDAEGDSGHVTEEGAELLRLSINPAVRREDKKTEKQRRKERERKAKVTGLFTVCSLILTGKFYEGPV